MADYAIHDTTLTGISNVIRKKEGSSALIDPADYPKRINLMGMLEEKSASGSIVIFSDGADDVPLKSCEVALSPSLDGYSSVDAVNAGKNLFNNTGLFPSSGSVSSYYFKQFDVSSGLIPEIHLKEGVTYTFAVDVTSTIEPFNFSVGCGNGSYSTDILTVYNKNNGRVSITFTPTTAQLSNGDVFAFRCPRYQAQNTFNYSISNVQLEVGSIATTYEPYVAPTTYSANLGRTVHGAEVDLVNGVGKETQIEIKLKDLEWTYSTAYGGFFHSASLASIVSGDTYICLPSEYTNMRLNSSAITNNDDVIGVNADNGSAVTGAVAYKSIVLKDSEYSSASDLVAHLIQTDSTIIITLATPTDFTFTGQEVPTRLGYNCFISEQGDTSVAYRASGTIHQYPSGEEASF